jgi:hypothetical protein
LLLGLHHALAGKRMLRVRGAGKRSLAGMVSKLIRKVFPQRQLQKLK